MTEGCIDVNWIWNFQIIEKRSAQRIMAGTQRIVVHEEAAQADRDQNMQGLPDHGKEFVLFLGGSGKHCKVLKSLCLQNGTIDIPISPLS